MADTDRALISVLLTQYSYITGQFSKSSSDLLPILHINLCNQLS